MEIFYTGSLTPNQSSGGGGGEDTIQISTNSFYGKDFLEVTDEVTVTLTQGGV